MQEPQYDVSIIVPVHNREKLIIPCIKSINAQTYDKAKWEVIFVDDGSTDKSVEAIESLIDKKINYRIIKREIPSGNASAPRNEGIKASRAKYVFFLDSDDYIHPELLKNGCEIAFRNDSDIVYFKTNEVSRTYKLPFVDDADIYTNHLLRSLKVFKMISNKLIIDNKLLFDIELDIYEDMLFMMLALLKSNKISILADECYYWRILDDSDHLTNRQISLKHILKPYIIFLFELYHSDKNIKLKSKFYNGLLMRCQERFYKISKSKYYSKDELKLYFENIINIFEIHKELFDLSQIYEKEKTLTLCFLSGDFESFYKMSRGDNDLKEPLKSLFLDLTKEFKNIMGCQKVWVYNGKIIVIDFVFKDNKIAFDLEYDKTKKELKIWMFCRNNKSFFESSKFKPLEINQHKLCIFRGNTDKTEIIKNITKHWEIIFTKGYNV